MNVYNTRFYVKKLKANNNRPVPEARLPPMMIGGILFPAGLFIFGWTSNKDIPWIAYVFFLIFSVLAALMLTHYQTMHRCCTTWLWLPNHFPSLAQLCDRHLPALCCKCRSSYHSSEKFNGRCLSAVRSAEYAHLSFTPFPCGQAILIGLKLTSVLLSVFHGLGIEWASSVIGFVAVAMIPIPFL
jgi:hypothetical protein